MASEVPQLGTPVPSLAHEARRVVRGTKYAVAAWLV